MKEIKQPKVSIVILNYNGYKDTISCIESVKKITYFNYEITVVDNGSTDNSEKYLKDVQDINFIQTGKNLGYSGGNNIGIKVALMIKADYILLLNNDTIVDKNFLTELINKINTDEKAGLVGGKIYYFNEKNKIWSAGGGIKKYTKKTFHFGENKFDNGQYDNEREVDFLSGCCLLLRREVIDRVGMLDPDYFMYYEDVDFCLRTKRFFKIVYLPQAVIWHKISISTNKSFRDYYRMRNHFIFLKKQYAYNPCVILLLGIYIFIDRILRIFVRKLIYRDTEKISSRLLSLTKGFKEGLNWQAIHE